MLKGGLKGYLFPFDPWKTITEIIEVSGSTRRERIRNHINNFFITYYHPGFIWYSEKTPPPYSGVVLERQGREEEEATES